MELVLKRPQADPEKPSRIDLQDTDVIFKDKAWDYSSCPSDVFLRTKSDYGL